MSDDYSGLDEVLDFLHGICPATGEPHVFREFDESPVGPRRVVHCEECSATP